jgi:tripartite ATP-independent transporter DctP family solute receptor
MAPRLPSFWPSRLRCFGFFTAAILGLVTWSAARAETLRFGYILGPQSQLGAGASVFADEIAKRTNHRYVIEQYPDAMLGGEVEMMRALQLGAIDLAFITGAPLPKMVPEVGVFTIPYLFPDARTARHVLDGPIGQAYLQKFDRTGMVALAWGENGMRHLTNSRRDVRSPQDIVGLRLRLPQSPIASVGFKTLGAQVEQIPFPEVYEALRSGRVDGEENPIATILAAKFFQVQTHLTLTGHAYDPAVVLIARDVYMSLSPTDQAAFRAAAVAAGRASRAAADAAERNGLATLAAAGMVVISKIDRQAFAQKVASQSAYFDAQFGHDTIERIRRDEASSPSSTAPPP